MQQKKQLVIIGSGFAAFSLLKNIDLRHYDPTIVSRRNHFLYTPLLPSTVVGTVEFRSVVESLRGFRPGVKFVQGNATSVDAENNKVRCCSLDGATSWDLDFDSLVIAVGASCETFGIPGVRENCCFLKELADARQIRSAVIDSLEAASLPGIMEDKMDQLLHFVGVGAGATGVRFAAELSDLLNNELRKHYPDIVDRIRITLIDAGKSVLSTYDQRLQEYTMRHFRRNNITIRTGCFVKEVRPNEIELETGEMLRAGVILWSTGFSPSAFVRHLPFPKTEHGRIETDDYLAVSTCPHIYAAGDCANPRGKNYPQLAQVAEQQGTYLAKQLNKKALLSNASKFIWKDLGISSYIGHGCAVADLPNSRQGYAGFLAYQLWRSTMFTHLLSWRNKILVPLDKLKSIIFGRELSRF